MPNDERRIPLDLTSQSSRVVGEIHSEFTARLGYVLFCIAAIEGHLIELKRSATLLRSHYRISNPGKKFEVDAEMHHDEGIKEVEDEIATYEAEKVLLEGVASAYTKVVEGASREMTRRSVERTSRGD